MNDLADKIAARLLDDLPPGECSELDRRIAADPEATALAAELSAMHDQLAAHHHLHAASPTLEQRMVAGFRTARSRTTLASRVRAWFRLPAIYIPATAAVLVGMVQLGSRLTDEPLSRPRFGSAPAAPESRTDATGSITRATEGVDDVALVPRAREAFADRTAVSSILHSEAVSQAPVPTRSEREVPGQRRELSQAVDQISAQQAPADSASVRKLIRNATAEIEVTNFDTATQAITQAANTTGGYVATQSSARLPNGKMSGTIVLKVPPAALDGFLAQLRSFGEVRNQTVGSQDVTKAYFDTEARLKNARVMEQRLVELLRDTKGKVSDLLEVERELGRVREQIEQMQGELKVWDSLVAFATVTVRLSEKNLHEAADYLIQETVTLALATVDVEKAFAAARGIAEAEKAQITQSNLTRDGNGNATAVLTLLVEPESSNSAIERLRALGNVLEFRRESNRVARDGSGDAPNAKVEHEPVRISLSIRSQDQSPTQRTQLRLETAAVEKAVQALRDFAGTHSIEIKDSSFNQQPDGRQVASLRMILPIAGNKQLLAHIDQQGAVKDLSVHRTDAPDASAVSPIAEVSITVAQPPRIVSSEDGLLATLHRTFGQAAGALMWSVRMIGVALAFLAPWIAGVALIVIAVRFVRSARRKTR